MTDENYPRNSKEKFEEWKQETQDIKIAGQCSPFAYLVAYLAHLPPQDH